MTGDLATGRLLLNTSFCHTISELGHGQNNTLMKWQEDLEVERADIFPLRHRKMGLKQKNEAWEKSLDKDVWRKATQATSC